MQAPSFPPNEDFRLASLRESGILDTPPDEAFDAIVRVAAQVCEVPVALVSLVDENRQWFKANLGLEGVSETTRDVSFCGHAIHGSTLMEVSDTLHDERFRDNPLVVRAPAIRFYAGMPLVDAGGAALGTLCVIDRGPRQLSAEQRAVLRDLGQVVVHLIEAYRIAQASARLRSELAEARDNLRTVVDNVPAMIGYWDRELRNRFANAAYMEWFGMTPAQMHGRHIREVIGEKLYAVNHPYIMAALAGEPQHFDRTISDPRGGIRHSQASYLPDVVDGKIQGFFVLVADVTARKNAESELHREKEWRRAILNAMRDGVVVTDKQQRIAFVNPCAEGMIGVSEADARGRHLEEVVEITLGGDQDQPSMLRDLLGQSIVIDGSLRTPDGRVRAVRTTATVVRDPSGEEFGSVLVISDTTESRERVRVLAQEAQMDRLTGLFNRAALDKRLELRLAALDAKTERVALLYLDVDGFKAINDTHGHGAGDEVLRVVAGRMRATVRATDDIFRLGGDEFLIVLSKIAAIEDAGRVAAKIIANVAEPIQLAGTPVRVGFSIGISVFPDDATTPDMLRARADEAMYSAKRTGRNRYAYWHRPGPSVEVDRAPKET